MEGGLESNWKQADEFRGRPHQRGKVYLQNREMIIATENRKGIPEICLHWYYTLALTYVDCY